MPLRQALNTLVINLSIGYLEGNSLDDFALYITVRFAARLAFIRRFKGILDKFSKRLNKERIKIFIIIIIIVFKQSLI